LLTGFGGIAGEVPGGAGGASVSGCGVAEDSRTEDAVAIDGEGEGASHLGVGNAVGEWIEDNDMRHGECVGDDLVGGGFEGFDFPWQQVRDAVDIAANEGLDHVGPVGEVAFVDLCNVILAGIKSIGFGDGADPARFLWAGGGLKESSGNDDGFCCCGLVTGVGSPGRWCFGFGIRSAGGAGDGEAEERFDAERDAGEADAELCG